MSSPSSVHPLIYRLQIWLKEKGQSRLSLACPYAMAPLSFFLSLFEMAQVSFTEARRGIPPFKPLWGLDEDGFFTHFNLENYGLIIEYADDYIGPALNSLRIAFFATLMCLLFAYPMAYWIARTDERTRLISDFGSFAILDIKLASHVCFDRLAQSKWVCQCYYDVDGYY